MTRSDKDTVGGTGKMMGGGLAAETSTVFTSHITRTAKMVVLRVGGAKGRFLSVSVGCPRHKPSVSGWFRRARCGSFVHLLATLCVQHPTRELREQAAKNKIKNLDLSENAICRNQTRCNSPGCRQISIKPISKLLVIAVARSTRNGKGVEETNYNHTQTHHISRG